MKRFFSALGLFMFLCTLLPSSPSFASPVTRISDTKEREVSVKKITVKGKTIKVGFSSDKVVSLLPTSAFMEQVIEGDPSKGTMVVTKSYYYGDKYFKLVFMRLSDRGYSVIDILEKRFD